MYESLLQSFDNICLCFKLPVVRLKKKHKNDLTMQPCLAWNSR